MTSADQPEERAARHGWEAALRAMEHQAAQLDSEGHHRAAWIIREAVRAVKDAGPEDSQRARA